MVAGRPTPARSPLRRFVVELADLLGESLDETELVSRGASLLKSLVMQDDWLPQEFATPDPTRYRQYLLHCDSSERFSILSFVWAPGQSTPIHDHTVWGLVGVLRGTEVEQRYRRLETGSLAMDGPPSRRSSGDVVGFSPETGDIHSVSNGLSDQVTISIHVYGANIACMDRSVFTPSGGLKPFRSGYDNESLPNIWTPVAFQVR